MPPAYRGSGNTGSRLPKIPTSMQIIQELKKAIHKIILVILKNKSNLLFPSVSYKKIFSCYLSFFLVKPLRAVRVKKAQMMMS
jgi:hypothetical protein